jgi:hypothetical protein
MAGQSPFAHRVTAWWERYWEVEEGVRARRLGPVHTSGVRAGRQCEDLRALRQRRHCDVELRRGHSTGIAERDRVPNHPHMASHGAVRARVAKHEPRSGAVCGKWWAVCSDAEAELSACWERRRDHCAGASLGGATRLEGHPGLATRRSPEDSDVMRRALLRRLGPGHHRRLARLQRLGHPVDLRCVCWGHRRRRRQCGQGGDDPSVHHLRPQLRSAQ